MLYNSPHHVSDIAQSHGWESLFLWQLTPCQDQTPTIATPVLVRFESKEVGQPVLDQRNGEEMSSSYQRIDSKVGHTEVEKLPAVAEQREDTSVKSKDGKYKNRNEEENASNSATYNNGGTVPTLSVTPEEGDSLSLGIAGEDPGRHRSRSAAFVDPKTQKERPISVSPKLGVFDEANKKRHARTGNGHRKTRGSLTYSKCWDDTVEKESDEMWRTSNIVTETIAYILWRSTDDHTDRPPWKVCRT